MKIAVLGASGFIGTRLIEYLHLNQICEVVPIGRSVSALCKSSRFDLPSKVADVFDLTQLSQALEGVDVLVNCTIGDARFIVDSIDPVYFSCQRAGVKRIVYLSSQAVYGHFPEPGSDEDTKIKANPDNLSVYGLAKLKAEDKLFRLTKKSGVEAVVVRPGIVWGPRSKRWTIDLSNDILADKAYLVNGGQGVCNQVYIDNLIRDIILLATASGEQVANQIFLSGDKEEVSWFDFYLAHAVFFGLNQDGIHMLDNIDLPITWRERFENIRSSGMVQAVLPAISPRFKGILKSVLLSNSSTKSDGGSLGEYVKPSPALSRELINLQLCTCKFLSTKLQKVLHSQQEISFVDGLSKTSDWLRFAGYPVV